MYIILILRKQIDNIKFSIYIIREILLLHSFEF